MSCDDIRTWRGAEPPSSSCDDRFRAAAVAAVVGNAGDDGVVAAAVSVGVPAVVDGVGCDVGLRDVGGAVRSATALAGVDGASDADGCAVCDGGC